MFNVSSEPFELCVALCFKATASRSRLGAPSQDRTQQTYALNAKTIEKLHCSGCCLAGIHPAGSIAKLRMEMQPQQDVTADICRAFTPSRAIKHSSRSTRVILLMWCMRRPTIFELLCPKSHATLSACSKLIHGWYTASPPKSVSMTSVIWIALSRLTGPAWRSSLWQGTLWASKLPWPKHSNLQLLTTLIPVSMRCFSSCRLCQLLQSQVRAGRSLRHVLKANAPFQACLGAKPFTSDRFFMSLQQNAGTADAYIQRCIGSPLQQLSLALAIHSGSRQP